MEIRSNANSSQNNVSLAITTLKAKVRQRRFLIGAQIFLIIGGLVIRWPSTVSDAMWGGVHLFRQTHVTFMIREYMSDFFQLSPLPIFGPPWQLPLEFPLFEWVAALGGQAFGLSPLIAGRLLALICFETCGVLAAYLALRWFSVSASITTMILFQFLPFGFQWGNAPLIEFLAVAGVMVAIVAADTWKNHRQRLWLAIASLGMLVAFLVKPPTAIAWLPAYCAVAAAWTQKGFVRSNLERSRLLIPPVLGLAAAFIWTRYADSVKAANPFTAYQTSSKLTEWNFGTAAQRLEFKTWQTVFGYSSAIIGFWPFFIALLVFGLYVWSRRPELIGLSITLLIGPLIFFNLYYRHSYYQCAIYPALVIVMGAGVGALIRLASSGEKLSSGGTPLLKALLVAQMSVAIALITAWKSPAGTEISARQFVGPRDIPIANEIAATPQGSGVILVGCDWDPRYLYFGGRRGLMIPAWYGTNTKVPAEWIGPDLQYLGICAGSLDPSTLFPDGTRFERISESIYRLTR